MAEVELPFEKYSGAGNDFIIIDSRYGGLLNESLVGRLCDRHNGIGADGLMLVFRDASAGAAVDFSVDFYNADGTGGMLCGNGARCALAWVERHGFVSAASGASGEGRIHDGRTGGIREADGQLAFAFAGKVYQGGLLGGGRYAVAIASTVQFRRETGLPLPDGSAVDGWFVDVGSRHLVVDLADLTDAAVSGRLRYTELGELPFDRLGHHLRHLPQFRPEGVNVNVCHLRDGVLHIRTWERGVEAETLACGTGSVSAALVSARRYNLDSPLRVRTWGGEELEVVCDDPCAPTELSLRGPARFVFSGRFAL